MTSSDHYPQRTRRTICKRTQVIDQLKEFRTALSEAVLLRVVGNPATMAEQLQHLLDVGRFPNVSIRVLPLSAGLHFGAVAGPFVMLDFPLRNRVEPDPPVIYSESLTGGALP